MTSSLQRAALGLSVLAALACSSNEPSGPAATGRVVFQLATASAASSNGPAAADVVVTRGVDVVVIDQVQIVARKIRLRRADGSCPADPDQDDAPAAAVGSGEAQEEHGEEDEHECPTLKLGPLLLEPPLGEGATTSFVADVPAGTYTRLRLQIHKPRGSRDQAFLAAHPDFADVSIRVNGTFNGAPFSFDTDIEAEEEIQLNTPIEVIAAGTTAFTLFLDVRGWFLDSGGSALVNPIAPSAAVRHRIEHNIRHSFRVFRDNDHDGDDDDDGHH